LPAVYTFSLTPPPTHLKWIVENVTTGFYMRYICSIGLRLYLLGLIFVIASLCLLSTAAYILYQANLESQNELSLKAETMDKYLELQLLQLKTGYKAGHDFPNLNLVANKQTNSGICLQYTAINESIVRHACYGGLVSPKSWPSWFESLYREVFYPANKLVRLITYNKQLHGKLTLTSDVDTQINRAWHDIKKLMSLFTVTLSSLCIMLYFLLGRALKPVDVIISGLDSMAKGNLSTRLPNFRIMEWQRTGKAINQLSANLEKTLIERNQLTLKLMNVQEEERRFLTRELHDEFGQCLAGLQATAFSMSQTAKEKCHELVKDCQNILDINSQMMEHLRNMLQQLHPSNIDEPGLSSSLTSMISSWNNRSGGKTHFTIELDNNIDQLPSPVSSHLFRIAQECLTNIAKHSKAKNARVKLEIIPASGIGITTHSADIIILTITDDGLANNMTFLDSSGIGLLGIRERVTALGGKIALTTNNPSGLMLQLWIPIRLTAICKNDTA
jgi:signal transduction histidine kinase